LFFVVPVPIPEAGIPKPMKIPPCQFNQMLGKMKILSMEARTALSVEELGERLKASFGKEGLGLAVTEDCRGGIGFAGGDGYVTAAFRTEGDKTRLHIATSGWAVQVKRFITELP
jgi:hypothetical protein